MPNTSSPIFCCPYHYRHSVSPPPLHDEPLYPPSIFPNTHIQCGPTAFPSPTSSGTENEQPASNSSERAFPQEEAIGAIVQLLLSRNSSSPLNSTIPGPFPPFATISGLPSAAVSSAPSQSGASSQGKRGQSQRGDGDYEDTESQPPTPLLSHVISPHSSNPETNQSSYRSPQVQSEYGEEEAGPSEPHCLHNLPRSLSPSISAQDPGNFISVSYSNHIETQSKTQNLTQQAESKLKAILLKTQQELLFEVFFHQLVGCEVKGLLKRIVRCLFLGLKGCAEVGGVGGEAREEDRVAEADGMGENKERDRVFDEEELFGDLLLEMIDSLGKEEAEQWIGLSREGKL